MCLTGSTRHVVAGGSPVPHSLALKVLSKGLKNLYNEFSSCSCMLQHKPWILGCKATRNVGVRAAHEQDPQQLGAYMGFFMLVPGDWGILGVGGCMGYPGLCSLGAPLSRRPPSGTCDVTRAENGFSAHQSLFCTVRTRVARALVVLLLHAPPPLFPMGALREVPSQGAGRAVPRGSCPSAFPARVPDGICLRPQGSPP